ncbi:hypothetical protein CEK28_04390 [Xenophilus sp. AP218F]|nr:hypothetical protein CEK28_04390 [Xenophilus sp. AP218F]
MNAYPSLLKSLAALWAAFVLSAPAMAEMLTAEGVAPLDNGTAAAREMAIRDALKLIAIRQGATVESAQVLENGRSSESGTLRAEGSAQGQVKVLSEFVDGKLYRVKLQLDTAQPAAGRSSQADPNCGMPPGRALRRKLVTTYFDVARPAEASDMPALATDLPTELARRLQRNSMLAVRDANAISVLADARVSEPAAGGEIASELGQREDVQFVVAGRVLSTSVTGKGVRGSYFESNNTSQQGAFYNGPFSGMFGVGVKYVPIERQFDMEVWIYDGLTGALLATRRVGDVVKGQVAAGATPQPFATAAFWQTDYGKMIDRLMDSAARQIGEVVACIPFSARVVKVEGGRRVYLNAGLLDGLAVGDKLLLYRRVSAQRVRDLISGRELGVPEALNGDVTITQVQPNFAIGQVTAGSQPVSEGDYARFLPRR